MGGGARRARHRGRASAALARRSCASGWRCSSARDAPRPAVASFELADGTTRARRGHRRRRRLGRARTGRRSGRRGDRAVRGDRRAIGMPHADLLRSARPAPPRSPLADRLTFGFVLRDLVRRRAGVAVHLASGRLLTGTIDRAGADHLDLALHEPGAPRRSDAVAGYRLVPFAADRLDPRRRGALAALTSGSLGAAGTRWRVAQSGLRTKPLPHSSGKLAVCDWRHSAMRRASSACSSRYSRDARLFDAPARGRADADAAQATLEHERHHLVDGDAEHLADLSGGEQTHVGGRVFGHAPIMAPPPWGGPGRERPVDNARRRLAESSDDGSMTAHSDPVRTPRRAFWGDARFFLGIVLIVAASVTGVWFVVSAARQTAPVFAAAHTIVPGETVTAGDFTVVDVALGPLADTYLTPDDLADGAGRDAHDRGGRAGARGIRRRCRPTRAPRASSCAAPSTCPASVEAGTVVELWSAPLLEQGDYDAPRILVADATVVSVTRDDSMIGGGAAALELVIPRADVAGDARRDGRRVGALGRADGGCRLVKVVVAVDDARARSPRACAAKGIDVHRGGRGIRPRARRGGRDAGHRRGDAAARARRRRRLSSRGRARRCRRPSSRSATGRARGSCRCVDDAAGERVAAAFGLEQPLPRDVEPWRLAEALVDRAGGAGARAGSRAAAARHRGLGSGRRARPIDGRDRARRRARARRPPRRPRRRRHARARRSRSRWVSPTRDRASPPRAGRPSSAGSTPASSPASARRSAAPASTC